jgi:hypothetical protein
MSIKEAYLSKVSDVILIELPKICSEKGNISVVENNKIIPFDVNRIYYLYDIPAGSDRGGHAHKELRQLIIAASGSFKIILDDGLNKREVTLNNPNKGLLLPPGLWRELIDFSSGSICLVLASHKYDENDYIRDYESFRKFKNIRSSSL